MDLFIDTNYKKDSENKLNYYEILYGASTNHIGYELVGGSPDRKIRSNNVLLIFGAVDNIHLINNSSNEYCYETKITANIKKFTL
jgi:hypothetical protein